MRIAIVTDAWAPQVNGVVRTYQYTRRELESAGHEVKLVTPEGFRTVPCPGYPSIPLAIWPWRGVREQLEAFAPDAIYIAPRDRWAMQAAAGACVADMPSRPRFTPSSPSICARVHRCRSRSATAMCVASTTRRFAP